MAEDARPLKTSATEIIFLPGFVGAEKPDPFDAFAGPTDALKLLAFPRMGLFCGSAVLRSAILRRSDRA
jgi:hypothetical protein